VVPEWHVHALADPSVSAACGWDGPGEMHRVQLQPAELGVWLLPYPATAFFVLHFESSQVCVFEVQLLSACTSGSIGDMHVTPVGCPLWALMHDCRHTVVQVDTRSL
jgi:hypothetical protein